MMVSTTRVRTRARSAARGLAAWLAFTAIAAAAATPAVPSPTALTPQDAQKAHAQGSCGSLGPGTGLVGGKGWIVSMLPGKHELRMRGGGEVYLTVAKLQAMDFDVGRPYYITIEGAPPGATLEWKTKWKDWSPVALTFLYPPAGVAKK